MKKSMKIFATKEDLQNIFLTFQQNFTVYYVPTYSQQKNIRINNILNISNFGINTTGRKIGNNQFLIFYQGCVCHWRKIKVSHTNTERYSTLTEENLENTFIDLGGLYKDSILFPTEISTIHYENELSNQLFNDLKKIVRKNSTITKNGYSICHHAYQQREQYRFCTINVKSPREYDLIIE